MKPPSIPRINPKALQRAKRRDRIARYVITGGGILIIATVVGILLLILRVALPLFRAPSADLFFQASVPQGAPLAIGVDEFVENAYAIDALGNVQFYHLDRPEPAVSLPIEMPQDALGILDVESWGNNFHTLLWDNGALSIIRVLFVPQFAEDGRRTIDLRITPVSSLPSPEGYMPMRSWARHESNRLTRVDLADIKTIHVYQEIITEDIFGDTETESHRIEIQAPIEGVISAVALDSTGNALYVGTDRGYLLRWRLTPGGEAQLLDHVRASDHAITCLGLVFGDVSIAVGDQTGQLDTWFPVDSEGPAGKNLRRIHELPGHGAPILTMMPSRRNKSFLTLDQSGVVHLNHMTTERLLLRIRGEAPVQVMGLSSRGNALATGHENGQLAVWRIENPHPEVSLQTLTGKVWYEYYPEPARVWQSSASNDDFEPKFSLAPLVFGSFKGTVYAMIFALPLALFGAIYTSQFTSVRFRGTIKPAVEVMAAVPSVVIGFLVALWLAPVVERFLVAFFLSLILIPVGFALFMMVWRFAAGTGFARRVERGYEFLVIIPVLILAVYAARLIAPGVEEAVFGSDFQRWLFDSTGQRYDQRNAMIIAFGLGFAVIPIIFTIADDALSNVPHTLKAASLALGASRWQTVWRVVLPSASPGIFAGMIIGFGRAIGETMIVLMATGNTPILDWSPFSGMRTLSANIAVEIPEAPVDGTLYRILFLSAVILFVMTSILNTAAELIRQRLRKRYGQFQ